MFDVKDQLDIAHWFISSTMCSDCAEAGVSRSAAPLLTRCTVGDLNNVLKNVIPILQVPLIYQEVLDKGLCHRNEQRNSENKKDEELSLVEEKSVDAGKVSLTVVAPTGRAALYGTGSVYFPGHQPTASSVLP
ncbi:hypothetical protein J6590_063624 [Homalodisca vitripennis]|nr:hypothetical protein J6590_063624 [Homalodisca vitripennis]